MSTSTFTSQTSPASTNGDGIAFRTSVADTFADLQSGAGTGSSNGATLEPYLESNGTSNKWNEIDRAFMNFNTGPTIPSNAIIDSAKLTLFCSAKSDKFSQSVGVTGATPASKSTLVNADYAQVQGIDFITRVTLTALTTGGTADYTLNASGIAAIQKGGSAITSMAIRLSSDIDGIAPTWAISTNANAQFHAASQTSPALLTVVWHLPAATEFLPFF